MCHLNWLAITGMIILMLRMIRMIILMGQDDASWFMAQGDQP